MALPAGGSAADVPLTPPGGMLDHIPPREVVKSTASLATSRSNASMTSALAELNHHGRILDDYPPPNSGRYSRVGMTRSIGGM